MIKKYFVLLAVLAVAVSCGSPARVAKESEAGRTVSVLKVSAEPDYSKIYPVPQMTLAPTFSQMGGFYCAYPDVEIAPTLPPEGYEPFFITHYGRHGSRSQNSKSIYTNLTAYLQEAMDEGNLKPKAQELLRRANALYDLQKDSLGYLIPRGYAEHRHIIERMYAHYPQVFSPGCSVEAYSTQVPRVIASMNSGMGALAGLCPSLKISTDSSDETQALYFARNELTKARKRFDNLINDYSDAFDFTRLMSTIFVDPSKVKASRYPKIASSLWILSAEALLVNRPDLGLYNYMLYDEAYALWAHRCTGVGMALGPSEQEALKVRSDMVKALNHMVRSAENAIASDSAPHAVFHYAHDTQLVPLIHLIGVKGFTKSYNSPEQVTSCWRDYLASPMGGNVQMVFFRKKNSPDILVKFMVQENEVALDGLATDCWPFYHWTDVKAFLEKRCKETES